MRVLIYVEPHPIRGSQTIFADIARHSLPLLKNSTPDFDVRMYSTRALSGALGDAALAGVTKRLIPATASEEAVFAGHLRDWETEGIPLWLNLMAGEDVADDYIGALRRIWSVFPFDIIVHWGENGAVTRFVEERPVTRIAMELGCTRAPFRPTVIMDPFGTNGSAIVPRLSMDDLRAIVGDNPMSAAEALYGYSANIEALPYEQQFQPLGSDLSARILGTSEKIAFLPLQLHDDANLLRFSPYDTIEDVVLDVVPKLADAGYLTVIKAHPDGKTRQYSRSAFSLARAALRPWADKIVWLDSVAVVHSNAQLMALADLVVTVNSSVGFEALYYDKVVSVLGDAVYKPASLFPNLEEAISGNFDLDAYRYGIGVLRRFMLAGYMADNAVRSDFSSFQNIALTIDAARRQHGDDATAIADRMYSAFRPTREHVTRARMVRGGSVPGAGEFGTPVVAAEQSTVRDQSPTDTASTDLNRPARRLIALLGAVDGDSFRSTLLAAFASPGTAEKLMRSAEVVDEAFYLRTHGDVAKAGRDPVHHWVHSGIREGRKPRAGLDADSLEQIVDELTIAAEALFDGGRMLDFPLEGEAEARRQASLAEIRQGLGAGGNKIAVVAHLYYLDLVPEVLERLANIPEGFDLVVTMPEWGNRRIADLVREAYPDALLYPVANRGRDIGPFIDVLPALLQHDYDAILHLQTKAGYFHAGRLRRDLGGLWRHEALSALLGSPERVTATLHAFRSEPAVHEVGPQPHYLSLAQYPYHDGGDLAETLLGTSAPAQGFFAGTMFWARPQALSRLVEPGALSLTSFAEETGANDGVLAHLVERLFGHAAVADGGTILGAPVDPADPLVADLQPLATTIHEHMESALAAKHAAERASSRGALAW